MKKNRKGGNGSDSSSLKGSVGSNSHKRGSNHPSQEEGKTSKMGNGSQSDKGRESQSERKHDEDMQE